MTILESSILCHRKKEKQQARASPAVANDKDSGHHKQHVHLQSLAASRPLTTANSYKDKELVSQNFLCLQSPLDKIMPHRIKRVNSTHRIYGAATPGEERGELHTGKWLKLIFDVRC